jgi:uncharacterized membrane protein
MAIALGLLAAVAYGLSDFLGGLLSRRIHYAAVALIGNGIAFALTCLALLLTVAPSPSFPALAWGAASGLGSGFGTLVLFRGLALGRMGIVAPLSALGTAVLPVLIGVLLGDRPSAPAWGGVALALPAIWLVSTTDGSASDPADARVPVPTGNGARMSPLAAGTLEGLLAGVGFALLLVALNLAGDDAGLWPVVAGQASSTALIFAVTIGTLSRVGRIRLSRRDAGSIFLVGVTGAVAVVAYYLSTQAGLLSIVAVLTALYPAATVILARVVLAERIVRRQSIGLALAVLAAVLIVLG